MLEQTKIKRIDLRAETKELQDKVVTEVPLTIIVNDLELATLLCSPAKLKELAVGYLMAEGFIASVDDLGAADLNEKTTTIRLGVKGSIKKEELDKKRIITSGCGRGQTFYNYRDFANCQTITSALKVSARIIAELMNEFQKRSQTFKATGGVHSAALCDKNKIIAFSEDIGRHNAVDKIIGEVVLLGDSAKDKFLLTSGRISSEILIKAARLGVPLIVSRSAPTGLAIQIAKKINISLVGFARGQRMNVYAGEERIL